MDGRKGNKRERKGIATGWSQTADCSSALREKLQEIYVSQAEFYCYASGRTETLPTILPLIP